MSSRGPEPRVMVTCGVCSISFDVSARSARDIRAGRSSPRCVLHRRDSRPETSSAVMRRWWLDRYTLDEIREMGAAMVPKRPSERAVALRVLLASASAALAAHDDESKGEESP